MLHTTFRLLKDAGACRGSYLMLARHLGGIKKYGRDTPIPLSVGVDKKFDWDDLFWTFAEAVPDEQHVERDIILRLFATDCAVRKLTLFESDCPDDMRPREAIKIARAHAYNKKVDLYSAYSRATPKTCSVQRRAALAASRSACDSSILAADLASFWAASEDRDFAERQWQRDHLRQYLEGTATPLPLPRKSRRKAA